jgi:Na+/H+ antiporter NhaD/arsenite permease-like protein
VPLAADVAASTTDPVSQIIVAAVLAAVFVVLALEKAHRVLVVFAAVAVLWLFTYLTPWRLIPFEAAVRAIDLNVLFLLAAMMTIVGVLKTTGVFPWAVARLLGNAMGRPGRVQVQLAWFTGAVSAVADNVTTVVFVTPMAIEIARHTGVPAAAYLLPVVMAANIGGAATLIGDPPNIMIGSAAGLGFLDFVRYLGLPVLCMMAVLGWLARRWFRSELTQSAPAACPIPPPLQDPVLLRWAALVAVFVFLGFATHTLTHMPVAVPAVIGAAALLVVQDALYLRRHRPSHAERVHGLLEVIEKEIEWPTLAFFAFLFIVVGAAVSTGLVDRLATGLGGLVGVASHGLGLSAQGTLLLAALLICWTSGILSAFLDNIPFVAVAIPVVTRLTAELQGHPTLLWWALAFGACLGGNATPVGASANVTVTGLAEQAGHPISFGAFSRFGIRVAALSLAMASAFLAGYVYLGDGTTLALTAALLALTGLGNVAWRRREGRSVRRSAPPA